MPLAIVRFSSSPRHQEFDNPSSLSSTQALDALLASSINQPRT